MKRSKRSQNVRVVLLTAGMATFVAACSDEQKAFDSIAACESVHGAGNCVVPKLVQMTDDNRPTYRAADECMKDFGEQHCEAEQRPNRTTVYRPAYHPGSTYFYTSPDGHYGYYSSSPRAVPPTTNFTGPKTATPTTAAPGAHPTARTSVPTVPSSSAVPRGGFGTIGRGMSVSS